METLLVGAGAVGRVLGLHLQRGGARLAFLVKPAHADEARRGFWLQPLARGRQRPALRLDGYDVLTRTDEVAARAWDCIVLCVSSPALRRGRWLDELAAASGAATVVAIQPGLDDPEYLGARVDGERLVWGMFSMVSYASDAGTAYWRPPFGRLPFSGPAARVRPLVETLTRGGLPARAHRDVPGALAFAGAALDVHVLALARAGWRFDALARDRALVADTHAALGEALAIAARHRGAKSPFLVGHLAPWHTRLALRLGPRLTPFDLESYFRSHFTKVGEQSAAWLRTYLALAARHRLPSRALARFAEELPHAHAVTDGSTPPGAPPSAARPTRA
jgi:2-dehydropantoate 2-reductase